MSEALPETIPVSDRQRFDEARFAGYLGSELDLSLVEVRQMSGGQSNPTFLIVTDGPELVLRKQPWGNLLPSAHALDREFAALSALSQTDFPVPKALAYCADAEVIGTPFYLMERLTGRIYTDPRLPDVAPAERRDMYLAMAETLGRLHKIDWQAIGLRDYGKPDGYYGRQIARWTRQWEKSKTRENPSIDKLATWLAAAEPTGARSGIVHGDFRLNNVMYHPTEPRIIGVLDWELSTIGASIADLAHNAISYFLPEGHPSSLVGHDLAALNIPDEAAYYDRYCEATGSDERPRAFHRAFALFRLAVIMEGIVARAKAGVASNSRALEVGSRAHQIADQGWLVANG